MLIYICFSISVLYVGGPIFFYNDAEFLIYLALQCSKYELGFVMSYRYAARLLLLVKINKNSNTVLYTLDQIILKLLRLKDICMRKFAPKLALKDVKLVRLLAVHPGK